MKNDHFLLRRVNSSSRGSCHLRPDTEHEAIRLFHSLFKINFTHAIQAKDEILLVLTVTMASLTANDNDEERP